MLRKLSKADHEGLMTFLSDEPAINLFIIGDVESFGYDSDFQEIWGDFVGDEIVGVLLRYRESFVPYFKVVTNVDIEAMKAIILSYDGPKIVNGAKRVIDHFEGILKDTITKQLFFCEIKTLDQLKPLKSSDVTVKRATPIDAYRIVKLLDIIEEFAGTTTTAETMMHKLETNTGRIFYIENDEGEIISVSQSTAENSKSAMVVGVATHPNYRRKGYTSTCMSVLSEEILSEGRSLCLFYDNPSAGKIYHKLGYEDIDFWTIIKPATSN